MESPKKTCNDQEKKKMVIKIDGGVGGIGAVILLGGALATAALASAFLVRVKGRSSPKDRRRRYQNPPPENNKQNEQDEENKGQEIVFADRQPSHVFEHPSQEAIKEVVSENDDTEAFLVSATISTLDEKDKIEINGGTPGDVEASYLCPNSPKKLEKDAVSDDGFIIVGEDFPLLEEKSSLDSQNKMPEDEKTKVELTKENVSNEYSKENTNTEKDHVEKEEKGEREKNDDGGVEVMSCKEGVEVSDTLPREEEMEVEVVHIDQKKVEGRENVELNTEREVVEGLCIDDGEISEEIKCLEAIEIAKMDLCKDGSSQEVDPVSDIVVSESHSEEEEDEVKALLPEFDSVVVEHENSNEESREDEEKYVEKSEEEEETVKGIVPRKCDELSDLIEENEENILIPHENKQEKIVQMIEELIHEVTTEGAAKDDIIDSQEVCENKISTVFDAPKIEKNEIKQEPLSPKDVEILKDDSNKEVLEKNTEKGVEEEVIHHVSIEAAKVDITCDEADESTEEESENKSSDEEEEEIVEESSLETSESSTESNPDAVLPAESPKPKLFNHEVEGKIQEDKTVKEGEKVFTSEKIFTSKFMVTNSSKRRMVIGMLSLVSSLSCSWFFGLSFVKLCIVLFLTMLVSEIHGY